MSDEDRRCGTCEWWGNHGNRRICVVDLEREGESRHYVPRHPCHNPECYAPADAFEMGYRCGMGEVTSHDLAAR